MAATAIATTEQAGTEQREQFVAFCSDPETYAVIDQVVGEMMLPRSARAASRMRSSISGSSARRGSW
jgi:hypothetical protein